MKTKTKRKEMLILGVWNEAKRRDEFYAGDGVPLTDIRDDAAIIDRDRAKELKTLWPHLATAYIDDAFQDR